MPQFIWVFIYSSVLKHFTEVGSGELIFTFHTAVRWIIRPQKPADSYCANYRL